MRRVETIIVGGGPAGSSCARELIRNGRECLILERKAMPRVKLCGGWITPKVLADLEFAPEDYPHDICRLERIKAYFGRSRRICKTLSSDQYSIRRVEFDHWLLERSGVETIEHTVRAIEQRDGDYVIDGAYRCRYLVGAGGTNCPVKKACFSAHPGKLVVAQEIEYETEPVSEVCTLWFPYAGSFGYAWYVPKRRAVNVGFGGLRSQLTDWDKQQLWKDFVEILITEECLREPPPEPKGYSYYLGRRISEVKRDHAWIVGDAAGLATEDLAEGIGPAIESGILAAREILGEGSYCAASITRYSLPRWMRLGRHVAAYLP